MLEAIMQFSTLDMVWISTWTLVKTTLLPRRDALSEPLKMRGKYGNYNRAWNKEEDRRKEYQIGD